jgi:hypothetical protein
MEFDVVIVNSILIAMHKWKHALRIVRMVRGSKHLHYSLSVCGAFHLDIGTMGGNEVIASTICACVIPSARRASQYSCCVSLLFGFTSVLFSIAMHSLF